MSARYFDVLASGTIAQTSSEPITAPQGVQVELDTSDVNVGDAFTHPDWYMYTNNNLTPRPRLTLTANTSGSTASFTVGSVHATTEPTTTLTVAGTALTGTTVNIDESVADQRITASVSAPGFVSASTTFGAGTRSDIGLQLFTPSGGTPTVAPAGEGSTAYLMAYYAQKISQIAQANDMTVALAVVVHALMQKVIPALQSKTYAPLSLSADETNALADLQAYVDTNVPYHMGNIYPSGGTRVPIYQQLVDNAPTVASTLKSLVTAMQTIPNLK